MDSRPPLTRLAALALAAGAWMASSCAPSGFQELTTLNSVRILASRADKPYAKPGDTVNLEVVAFDGRATQPAAMNLYWLPFICENPLDDAYFACFRQIAGGGRSGDAGAPRADGGGPPAGAIGGLLKPGLDLTQLLPSGSTYQFQMPKDAVSSHPMTPGVPVPYGLAIVFNIACAGHLEILPVDPGNANPQQVPLGCFDAHHNQLGPEDWVLGFTRVYAFDSVTNANPVISSVDIDGHPFGQPPYFGTLSTPRCTADRRAKCPSIHIGPVVPASSQEVNPEQLDTSGHPVKEEIWADFYTTFGQFDSEARLLYDATSGSVGDPSVTDNQFLPPNDPGDGFIWMVVHDNRGGAAWATIPVHVE